MVSLKASLIILISLTIYYISFFWTVSIVVLDSIYRCSGQYLSLFWTVSIVVLDSIYRFSGQNRRLKPKK